ncbi:hypothetical protein PFF91_28780 [Burkholderia cenocepacia]|uniref:hypothetical protein n=1 Tax=Burkholderia cenocepacia TaxID=95486 RepID=UPI0022EABAB2|nr:hypothetical protein [Burkholderia cenocepacia]MDA3669997.1 hypothetical protein [Burkholderia cenocepacia]MDA3679749.1 hypothetical protein [Burkholderia cenocepacia]MDA3687586.1 hypothetical protein [Burkholderia cenocepacia]MDA3695011.1 hypothetical protein [Burkholderia cenocepacia]MDA3701934.1 hypothetical protein [Burkholderia cenocepacia]
MQKLILVILLAFSSAAFSQQPDDACDSPYEIVYSNGILNNAGNIIDGRNALSSMIGAKFNGTTVYYGVNPNESDGFLSDLITVYSQKLSENPAWSWEMLSRVAGGFTQGIAPDIVSTIQNLIGDVEKQTSSSLNAKFQEKYSYVDDRVSDAVLQLTDAIIDKGRRVLLVGHSQGNLYANATHRLVYTNPKIKYGNLKVVGVANVAAFVADGGEYVTSSSDLVVKALRYAIPQTLPSNVDAAFNPDDLSGHLFLETYLNPGFSARAAILAMIQRALPNLREPDSSYIYAVNLVEYRTSQDGGYDHAVFEPQLWCNGFLKTLNFCQDKSFIGYIRDSNGIEYDPRLSPEFATVSSAALAKLQPFAPEIANPDSAITRLITGQWPRITAYSRIEFDSGGQSLPPQYASSDYDINMNFGPTPPPEVSAPAENSYSPNYPTPGAVYGVKLRAPLMNSIDKLKGKVSFDEGDIEIADIPYVFDIKMKRIAHSYRLRICKNVDAGPT